MANRYKIYPEKNFAISILEPGIKSFEEIYDLAKKFREDKDFSSVHYQLTDMRGCTFQFDRSEIPVLLEFIKLTDI